jgi:cyclopropane-fatty-acyl-phospholipid synthase
MSLEEAQVAKLERICAKLRLRPGERVVEAGCGWGALALHMARRHGVTVRAFNVSSEQVSLARARAAAEGLSARVEFVEDDYRAIEGRYDAFVSVGMLEHVGRENFEGFGALARRVLDPGHGRALVHFIGRDRARELNPWIRKRARFTRTWRLYLAGSAASFTTGWLQLFQLVFGVPGRDVPWGRGELDADGEQAAPAVR